ncbi:MULTISPECIES: hypothetical protein, partial [unclassified Caballeronia]|uniref:hypothetical protein n=1 Tax=unclassified Caballeronia TaxID=2646786 RepID=UPI002027A100
NGLERRQHVSSIPLHGTNRVAGTTAVSNLWSICYGKQHSCYPTARIIGARRPFFGADSTGRCNDAIKSLSWRIEV